MAKGNGFYGRDRYRRTRGLDCQMGILRHIDHHRGYVVYQFQLQGVKHLFLPLSVTATSASELRS